MADSFRDAQGVTSQEFLAELFEYEFCEECSGDAAHHTCLILFGNWFARCDYAPDDNGAPHPIISKYRAEAA
jgi:hypothetical protein